MNIDIKASSYQIGRMPIAITIGLLQGIAICYLYKVLSVPELLSAHNPYILNSLIAFFTLVPLLLMHGLGNMRPKQLALWGGVASVLIIGLVCYATWHMLPGTTYDDWDNIYLYIAGFFIAILIFILHTLIVSADIDRTPLASYATHFDVAWKICMQIPLILLFLGLFGVFLSILLLLIGQFDINIINVVIFSPFFHIILNAVLIAFAITITNIKPELLRGIRDVVLKLFSYLLPMLMLIIVIFFIQVVSAFFSDPNDATKLVVIFFMPIAVAAILLINFVYKAGDSKQPASRILRYSANISMILLMPMSLLAGYYIIKFLFFSPFEISTFLISIALFVLIFYVLGYFYAMLKSGSWMQFIEKWNFLGAILILLAILSLLTPIADPTRLYTNVQLKKLEMGEADMEGYNYRRLCIAGQRYAYNALSKLKNGEDLSSHPDIKKEIEGLLINHCQRKGS